jgi:hypothetical protein
MKSSGVTLFGIVNHCARHGYFAVAGMNFFQSNG